MGCLISPAARCLIQRLYASLLQRGSTGGRRQTSAGHDRTACKLLRIRSGTGTAFNEGTEGQR